MATIHSLLVALIRRGSSDEALGDEFILNLAGFVGLNLLQDLSSAGSSASRAREFAHVLAVTLDLLLLGVDTRCEQFRGGGSKSWLEKGRLWRKCLHTKSDSL